MPDATHTGSMIPFVKADANGNDFLVIEEQYARNDHAELAKKLCARDTSYGGADGIEFWEKGPDGTFLLRLFNSDGSEAELSGNGTRCVAAWLAYKKIAFKEVVPGERWEPAVLVTHGGPRACAIWRKENDHLFWFETDMGMPSIEPRTINVPGVGQVEGAVVNVGNPHFVIFVDDESFRSHSLSWQELGAMICIHPDFPQQTNVEFVYVKTGTEIVFRIYERGCGPTKSSGTGTTASAVATMALRHKSSSIIAYAEGGEQRVFWEDQSKPVRLSGPAEIIYEGEVAAL
jgi:diaminopimelate epimerase